MHTNNPKVNMFRTTNGHYIFDVNNNKIIRVTKNVFRKFKEDPNINNNDVIRKLKEHGFLKQNNIKEIKHSLDDYVEFYLKNRLTMLMLQVTQNCNFRCDYCVYSGNYFYRDHTKKRMSFDLAKKAIDFFIKNSKDTPELYFSFYGGEPLLEFPLIKKCVDYIKKQVIGKKFSFNMTTNGSLLNKEIIDFLKENDFMILISIDGSKTIHDKSRKFKNGQGTYDVVMKNMEYIRNDYPEYFNKIRLSVVLCSQNDLTEISNSFINNNTLKNLEVSVSVEQEDYQKNAAKSSNDFNTKYEYEKFKLFLCHLSKISIESISSISWNMFSSLLKMLSNFTDKFRTQEIDHHSGPCLAGYNRFLVNVEGNFFPCERVSELSNQMLIGNIDNGFYVDKIRELLNIGKITEEECKECFAIKHCTICAKQADVVNEYSNRFSKQEKLIKCKSVRNTTLESFKDICTLYEFGYKVQGIINTESWGGNNE